MTAAVAARPQSVEARIHLGLVLRALKRPEEALASFDKALALAPADVDALGMRGDALLELGRAREALDCFERILAVVPAHAQARLNRGAALAALGRSAEALADFDAAIAGGGDHPVALYNRANALFDLGRCAEALAAYDAVVSRVPQHAVAWNNRGNTLSALKRHAEALASFERAIAAQPDYGDAHFNRSLALLATGDLARGLVEYEWRWRRSGKAQLRPNHRRPLWLGEFPLGRKTILLHAEQGLGETIQLARYAPLLARAGATVILEVQPELKTLLSTLDGPAAVVARGEPLPPFDVHCPMGSLPLACKTDLATVPADLPYLRADQDRLAKWRQRIEKAGAPRIAIAWAGNPAHPNDRNRSIALARLQPLWQTAHAVSLQRELRDDDAEVLRREPGILHVGDELADMADAAAIVALCDLVVTVDTSVAHLAAAMGRPTWILLPFSPDWRWTLDRDASPWYPAARLFRQPQLGDWDSVIARVVRELPSAMAAVPS
jgi:Tfp pilus assembly protein PilF